MATASSWGPEEHADQGRPWVPPLAFDECVENPASTIIPRPAASAPHRWRSAKTRYLLLSMKTFQSADVFCCSASIRAAHLQTCVWEHMKQIADRTWTVMPSAVGGGRTTEVMYEMIKWMEPCARGQDRCQWAWSTTIIEAVSAVWTCSDCVMPGATPSWPSRTLGGGIIIKGASMIATNAPSTACGCGLPQLLALPTIRHLFQAEEILGMRQSCGHHGSAASDGRITTNWTQARIRPYHDKYVV